MNAKINLENLRKWLATKELNEEYVDVEPTCKIQKAHWVEQDKILWKGAPPSVDIEYDAAHQYIIKAVLQIDKRSTSLRAAEIQDIFIKELLKAEIITESECKKLLGQPAEYSK